MLLDQDQANTLNSWGIATFLNMDGWRLWGNRTAAYPGKTATKDSFFACRRYMGLAGQQLYPDLFPEGG